MTEDVGTLIARLREAKGADRMLDADIAEVLKLYPQDGRWERLVQNGKITSRFYVREDKWLADERWPEWRPPYSTASIDAALTLVPDNVWLEIKTAGVTPGPNERLYPVVEYGANDADHTVQARTIPLALCIAALEARRQAP